MKKKSLVDFELLEKFKLKMKEKKFKVELQFENDLIEQVNGDEMTRQRRAKRVAGTICLI